MTCGKNRTRIVGFKNRQQFRSATLQIKYKSKFKTKLCSVLDRQMLKRDRIHVRDGAPGKTESVVALTSQRQHYTKVGPPENRTKFPAAEKKIITTASRSK